MNDGLLLVNFGALQQASVDIDRALNTLTTELERLEQEGARLKSTWSGAAQEAYDERQRRWQAASQDLQTILRQIKGAVEQSAADYQDTERSATQRFQ
jgi:6 kDa early secretory antigenic target